MPELDIFTAPETRIGPPLFEVDRADYVTPRNKGSVTSVQAGFPLWRMEVDWGPGLSERESEQWRAFQSRLNGAAYPFLAYDYGRPYPMNSPRGALDTWVRSGGAAWNADGTVTWDTLNAARDHVKLGDGALKLPALWKLYAGDYVGLRWTTDDEERRSVHRVLSDATASAGGVASVWVDPPVRNFVPVDATAYLAKAQAVFRQLKDESTINPRDRTRRVTGRLVAIQDLRE